MYVLVCELGGPYFAQDGETACIERVRGDSSLLLARCSLKLQKFQREKSKITKTGPACNLCVHDCVHSLAVWTQRAQSSNFSLSLNTKRGRERKRSRCTSCCVVYCIVTSHYELRVPAQLSGLNVRSLA